MHRKTTGTIAALFLFGVLAFFSDTKDLLAGDLETMQTVSLIHSDTPVSLTLSPTSEINIRNDYPTHLVNVKIIDKATQKKILTIKVFPAGESISLSFGKAGVYGVCYLVGNKDSKGIDHCINLNLVKAREV
ncbi:MAG: hypothetical protein COV66_10525 [Nitrospinae bacterium CG11_big_fil_rev_8_21_14_0_20_45_15]|nr:MAG: hypothetical protein COV66_10525 [Nitrospinae bacterium CG11_big_fil_rev_8_21_14_0_20_45_15]